MVIFLYGTDTYRSKRKLDEIVVKFRADHDKAGMNTVSLEAGAVEPGELASALSAAPFLGSRRMVVVHGVLALKKPAQEALVPVLDAIPDSTVAVFCERLDEATCKKSKLWEKMTSSKFHWEFAPLVGAKLAGWVENEAKERGAEFARDALAAFTEAVGPDTTRAATEIAKLAAYVGDRKQIELADVALLVSGEVREDMFGFLDAVAQKQTQRAAKLLEDQIASGTEPMQLLAMLGRTVRLLLMAKDLLDRGVPQDEAVRILGVHPFAAKKSLAQARAFDAATLRALHTALLDADRKIKTGLSPTPRVTLDLLVAKVIAA